MGDVVRQLLFVLTTILGSTSAILGQPATSALLQLEAKIPLGAVSGRVDHMAIISSACKARRRQRPRRHRGSSVLSVLRWMSAFGTQGTSRKADQSHYAERGS